MEFFIEAAPDELEEKSEAFIKALADSVVLEAPNLAELLQKSLPNKVPELKYRVLRDLKKITDEAYKKTLEAMLVDIGAVLDKGIKKSEQGDEINAKEQLPVVDRSEPIVKQDLKAFERVKKVLKGKGYTNKDFKPGGVFHGYSTNMLIGLVRESMK